MISLERLVGIMNEHQSIYLRESIEANSRGIYNDDSWKAYMTIQKVLNQMFEESDLESDVKACEEVEHGNV